MTCEVDGGGGGGGGGGSTGGEPGYKPKGVRT